MTRFLYTDFRGCTGLFVLKPLKFVFIRAIREPFLPEYQTVR